MKITSVTIAVESAEEARALIDFTEGKKVSRDTKPEPETADEEAPAPRRRRGKSKDSAADELLKQIEETGELDEDGWAKYDTLSDDDKDLVLAALPDDAATPEAEPEPKEEPAPRRRRSAKADDEGNDEEAAPTAGRRRRRQSAEAGGASSPSSSDEEEEAAPPRRRRRASESEDAGEDEGAAATTGRSRRRSAGSAAKKDEITDEDLAKACSEAARELTPAVVKEILKEDFGVSAAKDVPQDQRRKLLDTLKEEMEG